MADSIYKEQFIEAGSKMEEVLRRLLLANEKDAIKSFSCMYLIRPNVSLEAMAFTLPIIHLDARFIALKVDVLYHMRANFF